MISEIIIYSDATVNCFDSDNCQISSASGDWNMIPLIASWIREQYPSTLPEECRTTNAQIFLGVRKKGGDERIRIPIMHFLKIADAIREPLFTAREAFNDEE